MRLTLLSTSLLFCLSAAQAQKQPYRFSAEIDSIAKAEDDSQKGGVMYSRIGNYKNALAADDFHRFWQFHKVTLRQGQKDSFSLYHAEDARQFILEQAKKYRIVIINEAHHIPMHRAFVERLLPGLKAEGFDMLGMEAFDNNDSTLARRGYPILNSGSYVVDPCYGDMMRKALALQFRLFGYDITRDDKEDREIVEAKNIIKMLNENPKSKIIIYCGYDHLIKDTMPGSDSWQHAMAGWLRLMTGIDPLTIDQTILTETGEDTLDNPYRAMIHADHSVVMIDDSAHSLKPKTRYNADISVYHSNTKYIHGRPDWQINEGKRTENINKKIIIGFPCLAFVYREGEDYDNAVPTDVIEIQRKDQDVDVILERKYKNVIVLMNPQGQKQVMKE